MRLADIPNHTADKTAELGLEPRSFPALQQKEVWAGAFVLNSHTEILKGRRENDNFPPVNIPRERSDPRQKKKHHSHAEFILDQRDLKISKSVASVYGFQR